MKKEIAKVQKEMEKKFGKNSIIMASELTEKSIQRVSTDSLSLDIALGGGVPLGRFTQISGALSSTKSSLAYRIIKNCQDKGLRCMLIQGEANSWTNDYGREIGIDIENLAFNESGGMEESLELAHYMQRENLIDVILFDSFESLAPTKEYDTDMQETVQMGIKPKLFSEYFRKYQAGNNKLSREGNTPVTIIGINQLREKIGAYGDWNNVA